ncbi:hypothetical protein TNCV_1742871 [Trichonephila clavipes]|nr:hypothetical protein TNCV_1742871 [Trichonephila clavipes]
MDKWRSIFSTAVHLPEIVTGEIIFLYMRLFRGTIGPDFNFVDDYALPNRTSAIEEPLENVNICRMNWMLPNPTDKFRGVIVVSMGTANHRRIWGHKPCLVGENTIIVAAGRRMSLKRGGAK